MRSSLKNIKQQSFHLLTLPLRLIWYILYFPVFVAGSDGWGFFVCAMTAVPQNGFFLIIVSVDKALDKLRKDGKLKEISKKYVGGDITK